MKQQRIPVENYEDRNGFQCVLRDDIEMRPSTGLPRRALVEQGVSGNDDDDEQDFRDFRGFMHVPA